MAVPLQLLVFVSGLTSIWCEGPKFEHATLIGHLDSRLYDASGVAASRKHHGVLYTHNDGDNKQPLVYAINASNAAIISALQLFPAENHDWEDIAVGPCGKSSCIFIGDSQSRKIYRVEEPEFVYSDQILTDVAAVQIEWSHGFDTVMVDQHGDVYTVQSHTSHHRQVGRLPHDQWNSTHVVHLHTIHLPDLHLPDNSPTSGDISPDGTQIVLLSLHKVHYWIVSHGDNVLDTLQHHPIASLPTRPVGATEGICWDTNGRNYYEVAERSSSSSPASVHIYNRV